MKTNGELEGYGSRNRNTYSQSFPNEHDVREPKSMSLDIPVEVESNFPHVGLHLAEL